MQGWIAIHRQMIEWEWYTDANTVRVFLHCLIRANHQEAKWRGKVIKRGTFLSSFDILASELKLSRQQIRTAINKLKSTNEVTTSSSAQSTVFKVENYDIYQPATNGATKHQPSNNQQITNEQPTDNQQITTNNNDNNVNNENTDNKSIVPAKQKRDKFSEGDMAFVAGMLNLLIQSNPKFRQPNKKTWAEDVRKLREIDGIDHNEMARVFSWANSDSFWSSNILSPSKLRKQWDQLSAKANQNTGGISNKDRSNINAINGEW